MKENGWLLDLYEDACDGLRLWFILESGERICLRQAFPVSFYIYGPPKRLHECCLFLRRQPGVLNLSREYKQDVFRPEPLCVLRVDMNGPVTQKACFQAVQKGFPDLTWYGLPQPVLAPGLAEARSPADLKHVSFNTAGSR